MSGRSNLLVIWVVRTKRSCPGKRSRSVDTCRGASAEATAAVSSAEHSSSRPVRTARRVGDREPVDESLRGQKRDLYLLRLSLRRHRAARERRANHRNEGRVYPRPGLVQKPHRGATLPRRTDRGKTGHGG